MDERILLSCPIANRGWILPYYLKNIYNIQYNKKLIDIYWILNNSTDNSFALLAEFKNKYEKEYNSIEIEIYNNSKMPQDQRKSSIRENYVYSWLSLLRCRIFNKCVSLNDDYLMSIDSDILVKPSIINDLLSANRQITASLIWNGYLYAGFDVAYQFPNILKYNSSTDKFEHVMNFYVKNPDKTPKDKFIEIQASGACILINQEVCKQTRYVSDLQGEDLGWARDCMKKGFKMYCMPHCYSQHVMSPELLEKFKDF